MRDAFYTIANVPYGSMLSLVTEDNGERAQLSTWRSVGSMVGNMLPSMILPMLIWQKEVDAAGNPVINPETGVQVETLLGNRVFLAALLMGALGYQANLGTIGQSFETSHNMCWLVAGLYLFSAVMQFIGLALIYNLDKKTLEKMNAELGRNEQKAAEESGEPA